MYSLVGSTGFVGSNIAGSYKFDGLYNSGNIETAYETRPDVLVYAGVRAEMFLANKYPDKDLEAIEQAEENIRRIGAKKTILISTVSVYGGKACGDENTQIDHGELTPYGRNRLQLEEWVQNNCEDYLIVRLPAIYGSGIKKNFIYDYIHIIPALLKYEKYEQLAADNKELGKYYEKKDNGFYACRTLGAEDKKYLISFFKSADFSALNFTDSRSRYQFYNLKYLWGHITRAVELGIHRLNLVTEPVEIAELYRYLEGRDFKNEIMGQPFDYRLRTEHDTRIGGRDGYIFDKEFVMEDIKKFVVRMQREEGIL